MRLTSRLFSTAVAAFIAAAVTSHAQTDDRVAADLQWSHGTFVVIVLETNQVVVAIDSRITKTRFAEANAVQDGVQKLAALSSNVGFFVTGIGYVQGANSSNSIATTAQALAAKWNEDNRPIDLKAFANEFRARVELELSRFSSVQMYHAARRMGNGSGTTVFTAGFAGKDADGAFRLIRLTCSAAANTNQSPIEVHLVYKLIEDQAIGRRSFVMLGDLGLFESSRDDPKSRFSRAFNQLRSSRSMLPEPLAAALLDVAVSEMGEGPDSTVGYPLFIYLADADGFRLVRKVNKGEGVRFDYRLQGK